MNSLSQHVLSGLPFWYVFVLTPSLHILTSCSLIKSQEELDEQFARQLVLQEQQQHQQQWMAAGGQRHPTVYQSTRPGASPQGWTSPPSQGVGQPSEFQEQFNRIAESTCSISLSPDIHLIVSFRFYLISWEEDFRNSILKS